MEGNRPPLEFANRVVRKFVDNQFGNKIEILPKDYTVMRVVFRRLGGSWEGVVQGDSHHCELIIRVVQAWGQSREKARKVELGY